MAKRNITLHDKHKSTTALYPKIDASSFTQGAIEKVSQITEGVVEEQVVPNPTLAGTEAELIGIQIGDTKYKIPEGGGGTDFPLIELDGSQITYNPTQYHFTDEQFNIIVNNSLVYIQIGSLGEKDLYTVSGGGNLSLLNLTRIRRDSETSIFVYGIVVDLTTKVGTYYSGNLQRRLYQHNILLKHDNGNYRINLTIINDSSAALGNDDVLWGFLNDGGYTSNANPYKCSGSFYDSSAYIVFGIFRNSATQLSIMAQNMSNGTIVATWYVNKAFFTYTEDIKAL